MKTKIIILSVLVSVMTFSVANTSSAKKPKASGKKHATTETRVNKGLAMEDRNQFN